MISTHQKIKTKLVKAYQLSDESNDQTVCLGREKAPQQFGGKPEARRSSDHKFIF